MRVPRRRHARLARLAAPVAFLLAATLAVLLVRTGLERDSPGETATRPGTIRTSTARPARTPRRYYVVRPGDTLGVVAARFDTTVARLLRLNPAVEPTNLRVGQRLRVA